MDAFQNVLNTITQVIAAFKAFFENLIAMFKPEEETEGEDATV